MSVAPAPERPAPTPYAAASWRALGTYVQLVVAGEDRLPAARAEFERLLAAVDLAYSRFRPDSELVRANRAAGTWVPAGPLLLGALEATLAAAEQTGGLVDPTVGGALEALGYDRDLAEVQAASRAGGDGPAAVPAPVPLDTPDRWREIGVDPAGAVRVPPGTVLDLGAVGKAWAADLAAATLAGDLGTDCVVSIGGDVAVGTAAGSAGHPWQVTVAEAPGDADELVVIEAGGVATSTTTHRRWRHGGRTVHHLLDPRTGRPVEGAWRTASVAAPTCAQANTASTAVLVLGAAATPWLAARDLAARLVAQDGTVHAVGGWPS